MAQFNELAATLIPGVRMEIDPSRAIRGLPARPFRVLVFGQRLAAGSIAEAVIKPVTRSDQAETYWGAHSQIRRLIDRVRATNSQVELWGMALDDDGAAAAATGTITLSGGSAEAGVLYLYIAGERMQIGTTSSLDDSATAIAAAINAHPTLPVSAAVNPGQSDQVIVTALNGGLYGNDIDIRTNYNSGETTPAGLTATIVGMSGGAANPDVTTLTTALSDETYDLILMPWTDTANLAALELELEGRWDGNWMTDGLAISVVDTSYALHITAAAGYDSQYQVVVGTNNSPTPASELAGLIVGAVSASAAIDPARGFTGMELSGALAPTVADRFTNLERKLLLQNGIATMRITQSGEVQIERLVTNWVTDASQRDLTTQLTLSFIRWSWVERMSRLFLDERFKVSGDEDAQYEAGQRVLTEKGLKLESISWFADLQRKALVEDPALFEAESTFERFDPNTFHTILAVDIVNPLYGIDSSAQFRL